MAKSPAWQRKAGKSPSGGLNAKGRRSYNRTSGGNLKPPSPNPKTKKDKGRKASFCARMSGMKKKLTSAKTRRDPNSRINKALRKWKCKWKRKSVDCMKIFTAKEPELKLDLVKKWGNLDLKAHQRQRRLSNLLKLQRKRRSDPSHKEKTNTDTP